MNAEKKLSILRALTTAMEKPEIANALIQRVINGLNNEEWVGLTDEEIWEVPTLSDFARAIEAKLKERNGG